MLERRTRPSRGEIDEAALALLARHGGQILATARRYAANHEDAEDAYQRALEILLTKAPTTREDELVPWLKTVVKHEAFALRRQRDRLTPVAGDGEAVERGTAAAATHDQAERYERLSQGAEALRRLKPQEIRCLVLRAQGLSYREICEVTGFTYTKVNRCLTEGRQALAVRLAGIEGGVECSRLAPLLSALADGEADAEALTVLRPHLKTCLSCRARLREFRAAPARVAALVPAGLIGVGPGRLEALLGAVQQKAEALVAATHHKTAALSERAQTAAEILTGQKVAALAASAAALAGGGTAVDQLADHRGPPHLKPRHHAVASRAAQREAPKPPPPTPVAPAPEQKAAAHEGVSLPSVPTAPREAPPDPANEFAPARSSAAAAPTRAAQPRPAPAPVRPAPASAPAPAAPAPSAGAAAEAEFDP
jgi:RNA polymerase sigma factor (sigma-70 family)